MEFEFTRRKTDNNSTKNEAVYATLFGNFDISGKDRNSINITDKRAKAILALLCLSPQHMMDRTTLTELLWPGRFPAQAKSSLRQCILKLSKVFDPSHPNLINVSREKISINEPLLTSDLHELLHSISNSHIDDALRQVSQHKNLNFLENISVNQQFDSYAAKLIEQLEADIETKMSQLKALAEDEQTLAKVHKLHKLWHARLSKQSKTPIAVLPFSVMSDDTGQAHIGSGITDEVIYLLGQVPQLQMIGRRSSFLIASTDKTVQEIAATLKVKYVIDGSVRINAHEIKVDVQLLDGKTGFQIWSGQYQGDTHKLFTLQENVAVNLANELEHMLSLKLVLPKVNQMTVSQKAYDLYLQGRALTKRIFGEGVLESAISLFEQALELDDNFSECWAALAEANAYIMVFTPCLDKAPHRQRLAQCADKALRIDPKCGLALVMKGVCCWEQNNPCEAITLAYKAYEAAPNDAAVVARLGSFLSYIGHTQKALPFAIKAVSLEPLDARHSLHLIAILLNLGEVDEAIRIGNKAVLVGMPSIILAHATYVKCDFELAVKQYSQTRVMMNAIMNVPSGDRPMTEGELDEYWHVVSNGVCSGRLEDRQKYCQLLDYMYTTVPDKYDPSIVFPAVWMGYADMVFKTIGQRMTGANFAILPYLWGHSAPANTIREHPDFERFCDSIGLTKTWETFGLPDVYPQKQSALA
jgi:TolB-like protein/DNA-binding winged helix-turn-helix (wHTH) protein